MLNQEFWICLNDQCLFAAYPQRFHSSQSDIIIALQNALK